jgi:hypothetical protein
MQLGICAFAIVFSAFLLPPIRRFRWKRAEPIPTAELGSPR